MRHQKFPSLTHKLKARRSTLQSRLILGLNGLDLLICAEECMLRHVHGILTALRTSPQALGQSPNVLRTRTTADTQVLDAHSVGFAPKVKYLLAWHDEWVQSHRDGAPVPATWVRQ